MTRSDEQRDQDREREEDEAFLDVWREWRQGKTGAEADAMAAKMLRERSPICASVARRDLNRESELMA
jgi:hypothetical protein